jgi:FAD/FMN-containing dehydrogenase
MTAPPPGFAGRFFSDLPARSAYSEGAGPFRIVPQAVAVPSDRTDLALLVRWAADSGTPLVPRGAGTGIPGNNVGAGVVVDLSSFGRPLRVSLQQIANAGAAVTCAMVNQVAGHFGLRLGPDPSSAAFCTVGGMVATNAAGARSLRAGSMRAWVRGLELVTVDGEAGWLSRRRAERSYRHSAPAGRRELVEHLQVEDRVAGLEPRLQAARTQIEARFPAVRKNAAGYALDAYLESGELVDLLVGSEGTLGIVTRVELQLERVPGASGTLLVVLADLAALGEAVTLLHPCGPAAIELLDRSFLDLAPAAGAAMPLEGARAVLLVDIEGRAEAEVRKVLDQAERAVAPAALRTRAGVSQFEREMLWRLRHGASAALAALPPQRRSLQIVEDGCVPVAALGRYLAGVRQAAADAGVPIIAFGHAGDGHLHVNALVDITDPGFERRLERLLESVTALVAGLGGTLSGEHGDGRLRAGILERIYGPEVAALFAAVKHAFDPAGVLNPGVIVPDGTPPLAALKVGPAAAPIPDEIAHRLRHREGAGAWAVPPLALLDPAP